jgi:hypothetical protein
MGGSQSRQQIRVQPLPGPNNTIKAPPPRDALIVQNVYTPRRIPTKELQSSQWSKLPNEKPVYVAIPDVGVSVTGNVRFVNGKKIYAINKLHPLSPQNDIRYNHYLEVPETIGKDKIVFDLKYAITQLWPSKDYVKFITDKGTTFSYKFSELKSVNDPSVILAIEAIKKDYPEELDPILSFRQVVAPEFEKFDNEDDFVDMQQRQIRYTTLTPSRESEALFNAFKKQEECMKPKIKPKVYKPRTATFVFPSCDKLTTGLSYGDNNKDFEDVSGITDNNTNQTNIASEYNEKEYYINESLRDFDGLKECGNAFEY